MASSVKVFNSMEARNWDNVKELIATTSWTPQDLDMQLHGSINKKEDTLLINAARLGKEDVVHLLLNAGADIEGTNKGGSTALYIAAQEGRLPTVQLLLDKGAAIEANGNKGVTPLIIAAHQGHSEVVALLINRGANINARDNEGRSALIWSSRQGHLAVVKLLCGKGADLFINNGGVDALYLAEYASGGLYSELVEFLKTYIQKEAEWRRVKNFVTFRHAGGLSAADWNVRGLGSVGSMPATDGPAAAAPAAAVPDIASSGVTLMSAIQKSKVLENRDLCRIVVAYLPKRDE